MGTVVTGGIPSIVRQVTYRNVSMCIEADGVHMTIIYRHLPMLTPNTLHNETLNILALFFLLRASIVKKIGKLSQQGRCMAQYQVKINDGIVVTIIMKGTWKVHSPRVIILLMCS